MNLLSILLAWWPALVVWLGLGFAFFAYALVRGGSSRGY